MVCPGPIRSGPLTFGRTRKGVRNSLAIPLLSLAAPSRGQFFLRLLFFSPVNGPVNSFRLVWSFAISSCNWFRMYSLIVSSYFQLSPCSSLQKCRFLYLYFECAGRSNIIKLLFPYPIVPDTLQCEGIATNLWIFSGQHSASIISTCFLSLSSLYISPHLLLSVHICPFFHTSV